MVLTEEMARKYFGTEDPVGKLLTGGTGGGEFRGHRCGKGFPENSHFRFNMLGSMTSIYLADVTQWLGNNNYTYIRLQKDFDPVQLGAKVPGSDCTAYGH